MGDFTAFLMTLFACAFLGFLLVAVIMARIIKKPVVYCLGNMFFLGAVGVIVWSFAIDDGSRNGWGYLVMLILWGIAAGCFLIGFILRKIGVSQSRNSVPVEQNAAKTDSPES